MTDGAGEGGQAEGRVQADTDLGSLRSHPFELLKAMERRGRVAAAGIAGQEESEWIGLAFRIGDEGFVAPRDDVREVLTYPGILTRIPGAKAWITGLANVRGQLLPVVDLKAFLGGTPTRPGRDTRVIVVNHRDIPAGLVADEVIGFRRFPAEQQVEESPEVTLRCERYLQGAFRQEAGSWPVFSLLRLIESKQFLQAARDTH